MITTILALILAVAMTAAAVTRWRSKSATPGSRAFAVSIVALAVAAFAYAPPVAGFITAILGYGSAVIILYAVGAVAAIEMLEFLRYGATGTVETRFLRRYWLWIALVVVMVVTVTLGHPAQPSLSGPWASNAAKTLFWASWILFVGYKLTVMAVRSFRYAQQAGPSRLRTSLLLLSAGAAAGVVYAVGRVGTTVTNAGGIDASIFYVWTQVAVFALFACLIASSAWAALGTIPWVRKRGGWATIRRLAPLWNTMHPIDPDVALNPLPTACPPTALATQFAAYRTCVEIRDWMVIASNYLPAHTWEHAKTAAGNDEAVAAAAWIRAGVTAATSGQQPLAVPSPPPPTGADVDADTHLLVRIATANPNKTAEAETRLRALQLGGIPA